MSGAPGGAKPPAVGPEGAAGAGPGLRILVATDQLVAVDKPAGLLVHNSAWAGPRERSLRELVSDAVGRPLHPLGRLDRQTSGVVLFVTDAALVEPWQRAYLEEATDKRYLALVRGRTLPLGLIDHPVKPREGEPAAAQTEVVSALPSSVDRCSLVEVRLVTGRRHQIRIHLSHLHHPVLGDANYGDTRFNRRMRDEHGLARLMLHCRRIRLTGPDGERWELEAPLPDDLLALLARLDLDPAGL